MQCVSARCGARLSAGCLRETTAFIMLMMLLRQPHIYTVLYTLFADMYIDFCRTPAAYGPYSLNLYLFDRCSACVPCDESGGSFLNSGADGHVSRCIYRHY